MEFESRTIFTPKPQCIVGLMGIKASKIVCGKDHVLLLTQDSELYSWGSNEVGQLGLSKKETEKRLEFVSYAQNDDRAPGAGSQDDSGKGLKPFNTAGAKLGGGAPGSTILRPGAAGKSPAADARAGAAAGGLKTEDGENKGEY